VDGRSVIDALPDIAWIHRKAQNILIPQGDQTTWQRDNFLCGPPLPSHRGGALGAKNFGESTNYAHTTWSRWLFVCLFGV